VRTTLVTNIAAVPIVHTQRIFKPGLFSLPISFHDSKKDPEESLKAVKNPASEMSNERERPGRRILYLVLLEPGYLNRYHKPELNQPII
jgi:hypothetical protein